MAKFVVDLLKDKKTAAEIGRRGRERAEQNFSLERQLNATLELYDRLAG
jgi:glycosyltransferase involved in cell wall biosynthesis